MNKRQELLKEIRETKELISGNFEKVRIRKQGAGRPEIKKNS